MDVKFTERGSFKNLEKLLKSNEASRDRRFEAILKKYGEQGVLALSSATPKDTGEAASSWTHQVNKTSKGYSLEWHNSDMAGSVPVVVLLQYGHGTRGGTFIQGRDFINPALHAIVERISSDIWKEVRSG